MNQLISYFGKQEVKDKYIARVKAHAKADELIHGTYWENGKGCAVGCTVETANNPHARYPVELGIPEWLAHLEDSLFESMGNGLAKAWPEKFLEAIPVGRDLSLVQPKFQKWLLSDSESGVIRFVDGKYDKEDLYTSEVKAAILAVNKVMEDWIRTGRIDESARSAAESAAESAAWSAESAARSAAGFAWSAARSAAWSAARSAAGFAGFAARSAAWSAAWSAAGSAAWSAAWSAAINKQTEKLLELLREA